MVTPHPLENVVPPLESRPHPTNLVCSQALFFKIPFDSETYFVKRRKEVKWGAHYVTELKNPRHLRWGRFNVSFYFRLINVPAKNYLLKVNNRNTRKRCEIFLKLTIGTIEKGAKYGQYQPISCHCFISIPPKNV